MKTETNGLEEALRAGFEARGTGAAAGCASSDDLIGLVTGEAGRKERERTLDHVTGCGDCAKLLKSLLRISGEFDRIAGEAGARRKPKLVLGRRTILAAVVALAGLTIVTYSVIRLMGRPAVRGAAATEVRLVSPKPGATLAAADIEFRWEAVPEAARYTVELFDNSLAKVWRSSIALEDVRLKFPAEARAIPHAGETYFWRVTATLDDGRDVLSKLSEFSIPR